MLSGYSKHGRKILWKWVSFDSSVYATKLLNQDKIG